MIRLLIFLAVLWFFSGCSSQKVRTEDLNSWPNHNLVELETHPLFSTLPRDERPIPNGERIINFTEIKIVLQGPSSCFGAGGGYSSGIGMNANFCDRQRLVEDNCIHQFLVNDNKVLSYKVIGNDCFTTCKNQPDSARACPSKK